MTVDLDDFCHICDHHQIKNDATTYRWVHHAFGNAECYDMPMCDDCAREYDEARKNYPELVEEMNKCPNCF